MAWAHYTEWLADGQRITAEQLRELHAAVAERAEVCWLVVSGGADAYAARVVSDVVRVSYSTGGIVGDGLLVSMSGVYPSAPSYTQTRLSTLLAALSTRFAANVDYNRGTSSDLDTVGPPTVLHSTATATAAAEALLTGAGVPCSYADFIALDVGRIDSARRWNFLRAWVKVLEWLGVGFGPGYNYTNQPIIVRNVRRYEVLATGELSAAIAEVQSEVPERGYAEHISARYGAHSLSESLFVPGQWEADLRAHRSEGNWNRVPSPALWAATGAKVAVWQRNGMQSSADLPTVRPGAFNLYAGYGNPQVVVPRSNLWSGAAPWVRAELPLTNVLTATVNCEPPGWQYSPSEYRLASAVDFGDETSGRGIAECQLAEQGAARAAWAYP